MRRLGFVTLLVFLVGCGTPPPTAGPPRVKATGQCFAAGNKPAAGAVLVFHRTGATTTGELPPRARVVADGSFTVASADGDGLPEGEYRVTVDWRTPGENGEDGKSLVADKFTRPAGTPLKASVKAGADGGCTLPTFTLTN